MSDEPADATGSPGDGFEMARVAVAPSPRGRRVALVSAAIALALALTALAGWQAGRPALAALWPGSIPMAPSTAASALILAMTVAGIATRAWRGGSWWAAAIAAAAVSLFGLSEALDAVPGLNFDLEGLVLPGLGALNGVPLGRMSPATGLGFVFGGTSAFLSLLRVRGHGGRRAGYAAAVLALAASAVGLLFAIGYAIDSPLLYGTRTIPMALSTGLALAALGVACGFAAGRDALGPVFGREGSVQSRIVRWFLPVLYLVMLIELVWIPVVVKLPSLRSPLAIAAAFAVLTFAAGILLARIARAVALRIEAAETSVRHSDAMYRNLFEHAADAIFVADPSTGLLVDVNRRAEELTGRTRDELIGMPQTRLHPPDEADRYRDEFDRATATPGLVESVMEVLHSDGRRIPVEINSTGTLGAGGRPVHIGFFRDLSTRVELEERLRQSEKMDAIGQLAGGVAHDFNNQLTAILGFAELIAARTGEDELRRSAERIAATAQRAGDLTRQLLAFARRGAYRQQDIDVDELVVEVIELLERSVDKSVRLVHDRAAHRAVVSGDPAQLQTALLNLGINARDAMPGGGELRFSTSFEAVGRSPVGVEPALAAGAYVRIDVADTGTGMPDEVRRRVFEPFFTTKEAGRGTGMGLAAVYGTISRGGGGIRIVSRPGEGTTFTLYLPQREPADRPPEPKPTVFLTASRAARVLVVDDEDAVRESIVQLAELLGHDVHACRGGREAIEAFPRIAPDVVILDLTMPEMSGRDVFRALRSADGAVPIVLSSGHSIESEAQELLAEGRVTYLQKPYRIADLRDAIDVLLDGQS